MPCFPQDYKILEFFEARYTKFFSSRLLNVTADTSSLSPAALLECLKWVDDYTSGLKGIGIEESQVGILNSIRKIMMETYLEREKVKIETWFKSILKNDWSSSPKQVDGIYITSAPQDLFSLLGTLIEGACSRLNGKAFVNVVKMCCSAVSNYQNQLLNKISSMLIILHHKLFFLIFFFFSYRSWC